MRNPMGDVPPGKYHDTNQVLYNLSNQRLNHIQQRLVKEEQQERRDAITRYVRGIQGRDGGTMPRDPVHPFYPH